LKESPMNFREAFNTVKKQPLAQSLAAWAARWAAVVPAKVWLAAAALILMGLWLQEHDARVRRAAELQNLRQQTAAQVHSLRARAAAALRQANQRQADLARLEAERRSLTARSAALAAQLAALRKRQQKQAKQIAALPPAALRKRLARELGAASLESPASPGSAAGPPPLALSEQGERRVFSALAERDACHAESGLENRQLSACGAQVAADGKEIVQQAHSLAALRRALTAQSQAEAAREKEFRVQLRAARGTWTGRALRALKFLAVGVAVGAVLR
jgi:hypothetical protein